MARAHFSTSGHAHTIGCRSWATGWGEIGVQAAPLAHHFRSGDTEPVSDLSGSHDDGRRLCFLLLRVHHPVLRSHEGRAVAFTAARDLLRRCPAFGRGFVVLGLLRSLRRNARRPRRRRATAGSSSPEVGYKADGGGRVSYPVVVVLGVVTVASWAASAAACSGVSAASCAASVFEWPPPGPPVNVPLASAVACAADSAASWAGSVFDVAVELPVLGVVVVVWAPETAGIPTATPAPAPARRPTPTRVIALNRWFMTLHILCGLVDA